MNLLAISISGEIAAARKAIRSDASDRAADVQRAINHAEDCLADLERAERLLDLERASAEVARSALARYLSAFEIHQAQQRRADEAADLGEQEGGRQ